MFEIVLVHIEEIIGSHDTLEDAIAHALSDPVSQEYALAIWETEKDLPTATVFLGYVWEAKISPNE